MDVLIGLIIFWILLPLKNKIKNYLQKFIKNEFSNILAALLALLFPSVIFFGILFLIFPIILYQINSLAHLSFNDVFIDITQQFPFIENLMNRFGGKGQVIQDIQNALHQWLNLSALAQWSNSIIGNFAKVLVDTFIIVFIAFNLLRDELIMEKIFPQITESKYENDINEILAHIKVVLGKYFRGLTIDILIVSVLNSVILSILNVHNAFLIGILSGILNVIPYIGPLITLIIGLFLGVSGCILGGSYDLIFSTMIKTIITLVSVNLIDGFVIQPYIFSNILKAHPLEIFLVIISAGSIGGISLMIIAIPLYVIIKVVVKEIFAHRENLN